MNPIDDVKLSMQQVAARYSTSKRTLYRRLQEHTFPQPVRFGGQNRWPLSALVAYDETKREKGESK